ncbi:hypothetical protein BGX24_000888 [Mortierella sp. AD032]|nr:hypothetical protein BGX24_000888 [Mortierella sp. AD032]
MLSTKNFRPLFFIAAVAAFMVLATVCVEAVPSGINPQRCVPECIDPPRPICPKGCKKGYYCEINPCTCRAQCFMGEP